MRKIMIILQFQICLSNFVGYKIKNLCSKMKKITKYLSKYATKLFKIIVLSIFR